VMYKGVLL